MHLTSFPEVFVLNESRYELGNFTDDSDHSLKESETDIPLMRSPFQLVELSIVILGLFVFVFLVGKIAFAIPIIYVLMDSKCRGRKTADLGFKQTGLTEDLKRNAGLIVFSVVVLQGLIVWGGLLLIPSYIDYVAANRAWSVNMGFEIFFLMLFSIPLTTLLEEIVFRGLLQERLSWYIGQKTAISIASMLFAAIHWAPSGSLIWLVDMIAIASGGFVYGVIYMRCRSVYVTWFAHVLADLHGIFLLFLIFNIL